MDGESTADSTGHDRRRSLFLAGLLSCWLATLSLAGPLQETDPTLQVGALPGDLVLDGRLDEAAWAETPSISSLTMVEPRRIGTPSYFSGCGCFARDDP